MRSARERAKANNSNHAKRTSQSSLFRFLFLFTYFVQVQYVFLFISIAFLHQSLLLISTKNYYSEPPLKRALQQAIKASTSQESPFHLFAGVIQGGTP